MLSQDADFSLHPVDAGPRERQCLADSHPGDGDQNEENANQWIGDVANHRCGFRPAQLDCLIGRRAWNGKGYGDPKSMMSRRPVEMTAGLAVVLQDWRYETLYAKDGDLLFPSYRE